jgi:hypothetical protein
MDPVSDVSDGRPKRGFWLWFICLFGVVAGAAGVVGTAWVLAGGSGPRAAQLSLLAATSGGLLSLAQAGLSVAVLFGRSWARHSLTVAYVLSFARSAVIADAVNAFGFLLELVVYLVVLSLPSSKAFFGKAVTDKDRTRLLVAARQRRDPISLVCVGYMALFGVLKVLQLGAAVQRPLTIPQFVYLIDPTNPSILGIVLYVSLIVFWIRRRRLRRVLGAKPNVSPV